MDLVKNAADKDQVKTAKKKEKSREENDKMDIQHILSSINGRRFLWGILQFCGVFETSFNQNTNQTMFNEGQRNVGLRLLSKIQEADAAAYITMVKEYEGNMYG